MWLRCVDTSGHLMAANLETWITVEVCLTSGMDVCHCHSAALGRQREWTGQQKGCPFCKMGDKKLRSQIKKDTFVHPDK